MDYPKLFRIPVSRNLIRSIDDPHNPDRKIIHCYVKISEFPHSKFPDDINPRRHEKYDVDDIAKLKSRIPLDIKQSVEEKYDSFHILNRGILLLTQGAHYDNKKEILSVVIADSDVGGLADGATTDRILGTIKKSNSITTHKDAYVHVEIISNRSNSDLVIPLTEARNNSISVPEFAILELGKEYEVLQEVLENSAYKNKIAYKANEISRNVYVRTVLGLLTLFHPKWDEENREPVIAYSSKGSVLSYFKDKEWKEGYIKLFAIAPDILDFHNYIHYEFYNNYQKANNGKGRPGSRKEIKYNEGKPVASNKLLEKEVTHGIPDGWVYPLLAAFRPALKWTNQHIPKWKIDPKILFDKYSPELIEMLVEQSEALGRNANAVGKNKSVWKILRITLNSHL